MQRSTILAAFLCVALPLAAQTDRNAERNARRTQQQLQGLQQQLQQAQSDKGKTESERAELAKKLQGQEQAAARATAGQRAADQKLKGVEAERATLAARVAELEKTLEAAQREAAQALAAKDDELTKAAAGLKTQGEAQSRLQGRFAEQVRMVTECSDKNERLVRLSGELIARYRDKGVVDALRQREPVLGLKDVETFNLVQDWRDKADAERFTPAAEVK